MRVVNEKLLKSFRGGPCEYCHFRVADHAHHVFGRGCGGGGRIDCRVNILGLCVQDHWRVHNGAIKRDELLAIVSRRENLPVETIVDRIRLLQRLPKESQVPSWV